jgi:ubiquinone/menaquinone biosynthesis C-methylase UbiE
MASDPTSPPLAQASLRDALDGFLALRPRGQDAYLDSKTALRAGLDEVVRSYLRLRDALAPGHCVLDWGCRHGAMSMLARVDHGGTLDLHGCDLCPPEDYVAFHARSGLQYRRLEHAWQLPYADAAFDAVIAAGTLEHVPNDGASLAELWRVLRPGGALLITHLPNRGAWSEWLSRRLFPQQAHRRRYALGAFRRRLLHYGFDAERSGYHQLMPSSLPPALRRPVWIGRGVDALQGLNAFERVWPLRSLSASLWLLARKREGF